MADWNTPSLTTGYAGFLTAMKDRDVDAATMFFSAASNTPVNAIRLDSGSTTSTFQRWTGAAWTDAISTFWAPNFATSGITTLGGVVSTGAGVSTADCRLELGGNRSGAGNSYIDFHSIAGTDFQARVVRATGADGVFQLANTGNGSMQFVQNAAAPFIFNSNSFERARIDSNGFFGIGTATPSFVAHIRSSTGYIGLETSATANRRVAIAFRQNGAQIWDVGTDLGADNSQSFYIFDNIAAQGRLIIDANGSWTQNTSGEIAIQSNRSAASTWNYHSFWTGGVRRGLIGADPNNDIRLVGDKFIILDAATSGISCQVAGSERMRLTTTGLGIGTSSPAFPLDVVGTIRSSSGGFMFPDGSTQATAAPQPIGVGQSWQSMVGSRFNNTNYQNTTGRPIQVNVQWDNSAATFQVSADGTTWVVMRDGQFWGDVSAIIPAGHFYRIAGPTTILYWSELR